MLLYLTICLFCILSSSLLIVSLIIVLLSYTSNGRRYRSFHDLLEMKRWIFHDFDRNFDICYSDCASCCDSSQRLCVVVMA